MGKAVSTGLARCCVFSLIKIGFRFGACRMREAQHGAARLKALTHSQQGALCGQYNGAEEVHYAQCHK
jgi:hypothetical protein